MRKLANILLVIGGILCAFIILVALGAVLLRGFILCLAEERAEKKAKKAVVSPQRALHVAIRRRSRWVRWF